MLQKQRGWKNQRRETQRLNHMHRLKKTNNSNRWKTILINRTQKMEQWSIERKRYRSTVTPPSSLHLLLPFTLVFICSSCYCMLLNDAPVKFNFPSTMLKCVNSFLWKPKSPICLNGPVSRTQILIVILFWYWLYETCISTKVLKQKDCRVAVFEIYVIEDCRIHGRYNDSYCFRRTNLWYELQVVKSGFKLFHR